MIHTERNFLRPYSPSSLINNREIFTPLKMDCQRFKRLAGKRGNKQQYIDGKGPTFKELIGEPPSGRYYLVVETRP